LVLKWNVLSMPHDVALIATMAAGLGVAFLGGMLALRLGLPQILGYLVAGVVVGPFTPGYVADPQIATQLADAVQNRSRAAKHAPE
jgi:CPA2 family monovalent cation:H+ antiporter-2